MLAIIIRILVDVQSRILKKLLDLFYTFKNIQTFNLISWWNSQYGNIFHQWRWQPM